MANTVGLQKRIARVTDLMAQYVVETTITDRGDLPSQALFVMQIVDETDPKQDELLRAATVADLIDLEQDRPTALLRGQTLFRAVTTTKTYDDVNAARAAALFLEEKLNELVVEYQTYLTDFVADPGETLTFPMADAGILTPAIEAYTAKRDERIAQEAAVTDKTAECATITAELAVLQTRVDELEQCVETLDIASAGLNDCVTALRDADAEQQATAGIVSALLAQYVVSRPSIGATPQGELDVYLQTPGGTLYDNYNSAQVPQLAENATRISAASARLLDVNTRLAQTRAALTAAQADLTSKEAEKSTCAVELTAAQGVLEDLERQEQALLDEVIALCPDYSGT